MLLLEKQKIASGFFLFEAEHRAKKEKRIKKQAIRNQELSSEGIIPIPSSSKTSVSDKKSCLIVIASTTVMIHSSKTKNVCTAF